MKARRDAAALRMEIGNERLEAKARLKRGPRETQDCRRNGFPRTSMGISEPKRLRACLGSSASVRGAVLINAVDGHAHPASPRRLNIALARLA